MKIPHWSWSSRVVGVHRLRLDEGVEVGEDRDPRGEQVELVAVQPAAELQVMGGEFAGARGNDRGYLVATRSRSSWRSRSSSSRYQSRTIVASSATKKRSGKAGWLVSSGIAI